MTPRAEREAHSADLASEMRRLGTATFIYLLPLVLGRGLNLVLVPVYTRVMTSAEYGIVGLAAAITPLVTTVLSFGLHQAIMRLHFSFDDEAGRRRFHGSVAVFQLTVPVALTLGLYAAGSAGLLDVFETIGFEPHLKLVLLAAYFGIFHNTALNLLVVLEEPRQAAWFSIAMSVITAAITVWFVVALRQQAVGQLRAMALASAIVAALALWITVSRFGLALSVPDMRKAVVFGLPLVPHLLSNWALAASDRWILERHVDAATIGYYSLGYTFGTPAAMLTAAVARGFFPIVMRRLANAEQRAEVPRLGTYALALTAVPCAAWALVSSDAIKLLTPPEYHAGAPVAPWIVLGLAFQTVYGLWCQGTYFSGKTIGIPFVTGVAAATNIGLNIVFVPRYGMMAAAVNTAVAFALLAVLHGWLAQRLYPISWEYGRWLAILGLALGVYFLGTLFAGMPTLLSISGKLMVSLVLFPLALVVFKIAPASELRSMLQRRSRQ